MNIMEKLQTFENLIPHLEEFIPLMIKLVNDTNFKICITGLNITGILLKAIERALLKPYLENIIENLLQKLGDSKIAVRQIAIQILIMAGKVKFLSYVNPQKIDTQRYTELILPFLKDSNWHMREEGLALLSSILSCQPRRLTNEHAQDLVEKIVELLDDSKSKVKNAAREAIIEILKSCDDGMLILQSIYQFLEHDLFDFMVQRLENPNAIPDEYQRNIFTEDSIKVILLYSFNSLVYSSK